jgi:hypothetical protein
MALVYSICNLHLPLHVQLFAQRTCSRDVHKVPVSTPNCDFVSNTVHVAACCACRTDFTCCPNEEPYARGDNMGQLSLSE